MKKSLTNRSTLNLNDRPYVTIILPTYKRAKMLEFTLNALRYQTYLSFKILLVNKPSGDETERLVDKYKKWLNISLINQDQGFIMDALNLGLKEAEGDIIVFLDDDAVPSPDWLMNHVKTYSNGTIGGVAGNVMPARLIESKVVPIEGWSSELLLSGIPATSDGGKLWRKFWGRPIKGLENYYIYISKAGVIEYNLDIAHFAQGKIVKSLLGMGANMSVLAEAVRGFQFRDPGILGLGNEQYLGWYIWKKGYTLLFNPSIKVYHLAHGETLTRDVKNDKRKVLRQVENQLLFYRLYNSERDLSKIQRLGWLISFSLLSIKRIRDGRNTLSGLLLGDLIGIKWLFCNLFGVKYSLINDLKKLCL
jgi:glycosyltransferase involved in cell wall biosynthesis